MTLSPETDISDAIDRFQAANQELALVLADGEDSADNEDRGSSPSSSRTQTDDGTVVGRVTVTDRFEAVLGEIEDPLDQGAVETSTPAGNE